MTHARTRPCQSLSQSKVALRYRTPLNEHAVFSPRSGFVGRRTGSACCDRTPLFEPPPQAFDLVAVDVDPCMTGDLLFVGLARDRRPRTTGPNALAPSMAAVAFVSHDPFGCAGQRLEQPAGQGKFVRLAGCKRKGDDAALAVCDHADPSAGSACRPAGRMLGSAKHGRPGRAAKPRRPSSSTSSKRATCALGSFAAPLRDGSSALPMMVHRRPSGRGGRMRFSAWSRIHLL